MSTHKSPPEPLQGKNENHAAWLLRRIWERINRKNEHFMGVIVGKEGSGKSFTAIKIANNVDPSFNADRIIFDVVDLLEVLKEGDHEPGQWYVLDEAGVQMGRRTWQDRSQILANQALQLIRDHNLGLIFTLPRLSEFDSQAEGRLQAAYEITNKEHNEFVAGKWKWFDPDRMNQTGTIYKKFPRRIQNGQRKRIRKIRFTPPDAEDLLQTYNERKTEFQKATYEEVIQEAREETEEDDEETLDVPQIAQEIIDNGAVDEYIATNNGQEYIDRDLIGIEYGIGDTRSRKVKKLLKQSLERDVM